jgi:hypothetical protein
MPINLPTPRRAGPIRLQRAGVAAAALGCAVLLGACGSSKTSTTSSSTPAANLDTARVARSIQSSILAQRHLSAKVICPAVVPQQPGKTFECIATTRSGKHPAIKTPFIVTVQSSKGYVTYVGK